jgi:hypothetical protein
MVRTGDKTAFYVLEFARTESIMTGHDCSLAVKPASMPLRLLPKQTWRDSLPIDNLFSVVSVLLVALPSSEFPERLTNYTV